MNEPIEITKGSTYIFVGKKAMTRNEYSKFKILEVTDTTYLIENIDADRTFRRGIVDFNYDYKPVEVIESYEQKRALPINVVSKFDMQKFKEYVQTYDAKKNGLDNDDTIVKDMLYGIGLCLNKKEFEFADGFKKFKTFIKAFL